MPPTEHPMGVFAGMAAQFGSDLGMPPQQAIAMAADTGSISMGSGDLDGFPLLDFMEQQTDQMLMAFHEMMVSDMNLGGYLG